MRGKIPIREGKRLCETCKAPTVVIFSLHDGGDSFNVTTYGQSKALCRHALGPKLTRWIKPGKNWTPKTRWGKAP